jgi:hypothetical protein
MSGIDYQGGAVTKQDLLRLERYVQQASRVALGSPPNVVDTFPKLSAHQAITLTTATMFATYFVPLQDQTISSVQIFVNQVDGGTISDKQVAICSVGGVTDNTTLTILGTSAVSTAAYALGVNTIALTSPVALAAGQQYAFVIKGSYTAPIVSGLGASANTTLFATSQRLALSVASTAFGAVGTTLNFAAGTAASMIFARMS